MAGSLLTNLLASPPLNHRYERCQPENEKQADACSNGSECVWHYEMFFLDTGKKGNSWCYPSQTEAEKGKQAAEDLSRTVAGFSGRPMKTRYGAIFCKGCAAPATARRWNEADRRMRDAAELLYEDWRSKLSLAIGSYILATNNPFRANPLTRPGSILKDYTQALTDAHNKLAELRDKLDQTEKMMEGVANGLEETSEELDQTTLKLAQSFAALPESIQNEARYGDHPWVSTFAFNPANAAVLSEGLAPVPSSQLGGSSSSGTWGYVNKLGWVAIKPEFSEARAFVEGLAAVKVDGKWGYIDKTGKMVIPAQFDSVNNFLNGSAEVRIGFQTHRINKMGTSVK